MDLDIFKSNFDIAEVIGSFIPLKKSGVNFEACCPFHNEKSPSFIVSPQKQIYKCFGCGAGGDVISFVKDYKKLEFREAIEELCAMYNIANPMTKAPSKTKQIQESLKNLSDRFTQNLLSDDEIAQKIRNYIEKRGFESQDIQRFALGYCKGNEWQEFFTQDLAKEAGIISQKGYCLFTNRLVITLFSPSYKVIGFVGRTHPYFNFRNSPKYINSKESTLYQKSRNFYNFARAKSHILAQKKVLVVEGYMDALSAWKMGIKNCVATGGTAFNKTFLAQLIPLDAEITFLFDNDEAGQKNITSAIRVCLENGYNNIYKGNLLNEVKDLGEVLESQEKPKITKTKGVQYYLKSTLNALATTKAKDEFLKSYKDFVLCQKNHFFKIDLINESKKALGFDIFSDKNISHTNKHKSDISTQIFTSIVNNKDCAYIALEYLDGDELGEYTLDYKNFLQGTLTQKAQELSLKQESLDLKAFRQGLCFLLTKHYDDLIFKASIDKDFAYARALSMKKANIRKTLG